MMSLIDDPAQATIELLAEEVHRDLLANASSTTANSHGQASLWISPIPVIIKMRIFCLPYAGGVSANVFSRWVLLSTKPDFLQLT